MCTVFFLRGRVSSPCVARTSVHTRTRGAPSTHSRARQISSHRPVLQKYTPVADQASCPNPSLCQLPVCPAGLSHGRLGSFFPSPNTVCGPVNPWPSPLSNMPLVPGGFIQGRRGSLSPPANTVVGPPKEDSSRLKVPSVPWGFIHGRWGSFSPPPKTVSGPWNPSPSPLLNDPSVPCFFHGCRVSFPPANTVWGPSKELSCRSNDPDVPFW
mmetsp:Transcript_6161/g.14928  ORF Transcript_6161/g.14928 Transcript_6161/m.14928 type:complete len:212 (-) Transcript_6161:552-1187(-)